MIEILNGRDHFYQWDINQRIKVNNPIIKEIHYDNGTGLALVCEVYEREGQKVADVPNILLLCFVKTLNLLTWFSFLNIVKYLIVLSYIPGPVKLISSSNL
jgi:hypothetical protein